MFEGVKELGEIKGALLMVKHELQRFNVPAAILHLRVALTKVNNLIELEYA